MIDVSFPLREGMPGFPGDPPVIVKRVRQIEQGDPYNLSMLSMSSHSGTHLDPPFHFVDSAPGGDGVPLERLNGPALVIDLSGASTIDARALAGKVPAGTERLLIRTSNSARWKASATFFPDYVALEPSAAESLLARGIRLVGIDALSIERDSSGQFPVHHALLGQDCLILEGLWLSEAPAGRYTLQCLPLRIVHGDGAPCRATLTPL